MTNDSPNADRQSRTANARPPKLNYDLTKLVAAMSPENAHPEVDWGEPQGEEAW